MGIVGGGQLAVMMTEAAHRLGLGVEALARCPDDPIFRILPNARVGDARCEEDLQWLADRTDVLTFDHELIDHRVLARLEADGVLSRPGSCALSVAVNKQLQADLFTALGLRQPDTIVVSDVNAALSAIRAFDDAAVLKTATGGYDGRGILLDVSESVVRQWFRSEVGTVLVQRREAIADELAVQVVRGADGIVAGYAPVRTVQSDGMCSYVSVPGEFDDSLERTAITIASQIATAIDVVGLLTVEFFVVDGELMVNELAARPHNSGHLTIEATRTSQFENHMRAVAGLPLGSTAMVVPAAAMANVIGGLTPAARGALFGDEVAVHLYGKRSRPGRKIGHVTAVADSPQEAIVRAVRAANELQTTV